MKKFLVVLLSVSLSAGSAYGYGSPGHALVGAIADKRLEKNPAVAAKVKELLHGLSLKQAATLPDAIKNWDDPNPKTCNNTRFDNSPVTEAKQIEDDLRAFLKANLCSSHPSHHEFHYTDVPVFGDEDYDGGTVGREDFDIVKMIPFCIRVLKDQEPQPNNRAITKSVAVVLLAHYLGDIHQPLHVGAEYFDANGNAFEPTSPNEGFADQGGNKLTLFTFFNGKLTSAGKFHSYWDGQTVTNAFGSATSATVAAKLAKSEPVHWKLSGGVETWAKQMANEILPVAREAHTRLAFSKVTTQPHHRDINGGDAKEKKPQPGGKFYAIWAADTVKEEIHKAGWRLAALLEAVLQ
ncbi:MAG: S1/P1 nuclease [Pyrinomonadaceae bacterium]